MKLLKTVAIAVAANLGMFVVIFMLSVISGRTFEQAFGFPLTINVFVFTFLVCWLAVIIATPYRKV